MKPNSGTRERKLLTTMTREPFQPVRLHYAVPDRSSVIGTFKKLECMMAVPEAKCWQWLYHAEVASLRFTFGSYDDVPLEMRPIVLGRIHFPKQGTMTLETYSIDRAIAGAKFFAPRLGPGIVATRVRIVNRCFAAEEGQPYDLMALLDRDVTVVDPSKAEAALRQELKGVRSIEDVNRVFARMLERKIKSKEEDVPLVEDFPLAPEEETPTFEHQSNMLSFRFIRAFEHWRGNTEVTLAAIIARAVKDLPANA